MGEAVTVPLEKIAVLWVLGKSGNVIGWWYHPSKSALEAKREEVEALGFGTMFQTYTLEYSDVSASVAIEELPAGFGIVGVDPDEPIGSISGIPVVGDEVHFVVDDAEPFPPVKVYGVNDLQARIRRDELLARHNSILGVADVKARAASIASIMKISRDREEVGDSHYDVDWARTFAYQTLATAILNLEVIESDDVVWEVKVDSSGVVEVWIYREGSGWSERFIAMCDETNRDDGRQVDDFVTEVRDLIERAEAHIFHDAEQPDDHVADRFQDAESDVIEIGGRKFRPFTRHAFVGDRVYYPRGDLFGTVADLADESPVCLIRFEFPYSDPAAFNCHIEALLVEVTE